MLKTLITRETLLLTIIVILIALITMRFPSFASPSNLLSVFNDTSLLIMLAIGQMIVILTKCVDLSVAANLALTGMIVSLLNVAAPSVPVAIIIPLSILIGGALGAINGLFIWKLQVPSIVMTLGTMTIFRGVIFLISDGEWVNAHEMSESFKAFARANFIGLPMLSVVAIFTMALFVLVMNRTPYGRSVYAVGGNPTAATYAGFNVGRVQFLAFTINGAIAGLVGYLWVTRYAVAYVDIASGFELDVIAACVIGGVAISGGSGTVIGAVLGALFIGIIKNALPVMNISPFWQLAISGAAIVIAVVVNAYTNREKGRVILKSAEERHG